MDEGHRLVKKNFETERWADGQKLPLNLFVQEIAANVLLCFSKIIEGLDTAPKKNEENQENSQASQSARAPLLLNMRQR